MCLPTEFSPFDRKGAFVDLVKIVTFSAALLGATCFANASDGFTATGRGWSSHVALVNAHHLIYLQAHAEMEECLRVSAVVKWAVEAESCAHESIQSWVCISKLQLTCSLP